MKQRIDKILFNSAKINLTSQNNQSITFIPKRNKIIKFIWLNYLRI